MLSLVQGGAGNIPLWMEPLDGNSSDKSSFQKTVRRVQSFASSLKAMPEGLCFVVDAAFYVPEKLAELNNVFWITRVPAQLKEARVLLAKPKNELIWEDFDSNYRGSIHETTVYGLPQRWVVIESAHAAKRELKTFQRQLDKKAQTTIKALWHLSNQVFQCKSDAQKALKAVIKSLKYHQVHYEIVPIEGYSCKGRPKADTQKIITGYQVQACLATHIDTVRAKQDTLGRFILATNQCDYSLLDNHSILKQYKEQSCVESGFKFIKNDAFELDSFFLKTPERISALMMIMTLCLMVYNFAQAHLRECLKESDETLPNQVNKQVKTPTMSWVFELMSPIAVVTIRSNNQKQRIVTNLKPVHQQIIAYFGIHAQIIYGLSGSDLVSKTKYWSNYQKLNCQKLLN